MILGKQWVSAKFMEKSILFHIMYYKGRVADPRKVVGLTSPREDRGVVYTGCN